MIDVAKVKVSSAMALFCCLCVPFVVCLLVFVTDADYYENSDILRMSFLIIGASSILITINSIIIGLGLTLTEKIKFDQPGLRDKLAFVAGGQYSVGLITVLLILQLIYPVSFTTLALITFAIEVLFLIIAIVGMNKAAENKTLLIQEDNSKDL